VKAAIYARVSTISNQEVENQLVQLRDFATSQNWTIAAEYIDHDSGVKAARSEFKRLFDDATKRKFDVVLFWALDRFTREGSLETLRYLDQLSSYGVGFRSFTESYLDSCGMFRDAIIAILGAIAKQERTRIRERVEAGLSRARTHGTRSGNPIGRPRVILNRDEALMLRQQGLSWREIGSKLHAGATTVRRACKAAQACQNIVAVQP
jgi:DNA invertase Pin-like site-specific DNA recombinase